MESMPYAFFCIDDAVSGLMAAYGAVEASCGATERYTHAGWVPVPFRDIVHFWDAQGREVGYVVAFIQDNPTIFAAGGRYRTWDPGFKEHYRSYLAPLPPRFLTPASPAGELIAAQT